MYANLNHCKVIKADCSQLIPRKLAANLELSVVVWLIWSFVFQFSRKIIPHYFIFSVFALVRHLDCVKFHCCYPFSFYTTCNKCNEDKLQCYLAHQFLPVQECILACFFKQFLAWFFFYFTDCFLIEERLEKTRGASRGSVWLSWQTPLHRKYSALKPIKY